MNPVFLGNPDEIMPSRIIREDWLDSETVNRLDASEERFLLRLCLRADDYGRFHANPLLLKSNLFPLTEAVRSTDIARWLAACEKSGVVRCYESEGKRFVEIQKFRQRTRAEHSKFPEPPPKPPDAVQMPDTCQADDGHPRTYSYSYSKSYAGKRSAHAEPTSDEEWLKQLSSEPAYEGLNVPHEFGRMTQWCKANHKQPTRRRFVNWLNRCDKPVNGLNPKPPRVVGRPAPSKEDAPV